METVQFYFLPAERERMDEVVKTLGKAARRKYVASYDQFDRFVEAVIQTKEVAGVMNTACALALMCDIVEEWLAAQSENEQDAEQPTNDKEAR